MPRENFSYYTEYLKPYTEIQGLVISLMLRLDSLWGESTPEMSRAFRNSIQLTPPDNALDAAEVIRECIQTLWKWFPRAKFHPRVQEGVMDLVAPDGPFDLMASDEQVKAICNALDELFHLLRGIQVIADLAARAVDGCIHGWASESQMYEAMEVFRYGLDALMPGTA